MKLTPEDLRDLTWENLQPFLAGSRLAVLEAWRQHGPGTTRQIAQRSGIDLLTFRPRTTELCALGLIYLDDRDGNQGVYAAVPAHHAQRHFEIAIRAHRAAEQTLLKI